jgi:very-short-patch-repair endonuclease
MNHHPVPKTNRTNARSMRKVMTDAELKLWNELRAHRLMNLSFRRQMPIAGYIVDFACPSKKIVVEVDGSQHGADHVADADRRRSEALEALGWTILRFWNDDVLRDMDGVCSHIVAAAGLAAADAATRALDHPDGAPLRGRPADPRDGEGSGKRAAATSLQGVFP